MDAKISSFVICFGINSEEIGVHEDVFYPVLEKILEEGYEGEELKEALKKNIHELIPKHITKEDILASINYNIHLEYGIGHDDDIDHLGKYFCSTFFCLDHNTCYGCVLDLICKFHVHIRSSFC